MESVKKQKGFTLLELMVVLAIIGVVGAITAPSLMEIPEKARVTAAKSDLASIKQALKLYKLDNQRYPTTEQGLQALTTRPSGAVSVNWRQYLEKLPNDPWGTPYQYLTPGIKGDVDVLSFGADGKAGGENFDADIGSWQ